MQVRERNGPPAGDSLGVSSLDELAGVIRDQALASALGKLAPSRRTIPAAALFEQPSFRRPFVQALGLGVAQALAANDQRVRAVYAYEAEPATSAARQETTLAHLLVLVTAPSAALEAFMAALNRALSVSVNDLTGARFGQGQPLLDISVVTEQHVQQGVGLARLLSAVRPQPVRLWQRPD